MAFSTLDIKSREGVLKSCYEFLLLMMMKIFGPYIERSWNAKVLKLRKLLMGMQGLNFFRKNPADLIITDILMPEKKVLRLSKEFKEDFPDVKIIGFQAAVHSEIRKSILE